MKGKIILLEREADPGKDLPGLITRLGYQCLMVRGYSEAMELLSSRTFDVLIVDASDLKSHGLVFFKEVAKAQPFAEVLVIIGKGAPFSCKEVIEAGATDFIERPFKPEEVDARLSRVFRERRLKERLIRISTHDSLTGLYNRRYFFEKIKEEMERARRQARSLSLIMLDIDKFKNYNDTYGHIEGDHVLERLGRILKRCIRQNVDTAYRYGGDEFAVLLVETNIDQALRIAERIRAAYEEEQEGFTTLSLGVAEFNKRDKLKDLVRKADDAMYEAKRSGGNRIMHHIDGMKRGQETMG